VLIAIGNGDPGDPVLVAAARRCLDDPAPLVRAAAVWAAMRLAPLSKAERARHLAAEVEPIVREEWARCSDLSPA
jgi:epoxyqueuosine reductase